jgi:hypothetical protein
MKPQRRTAATATRRTTLSSADSRAAAQRSEELLRLYKEAFTDFSDEEMLVLDGILLEPATKRR